MIDIMLTKSFTGHTHYGSAMESDDNCGTCDGAKCDSCKTRYRVEYLKNEKIIYSGYDKDKAYRMYVDAFVEYCKNNSKNVSVKDIIIENNNNWYTAYAYANNISNHIFTCDRHGLELAIAGLESGTPFIEIREEYVYMVLLNDSILLNEYCIDISEKEKLAEIFKSIIKK